MEVGRLTPYRFRILVGDTFDITEVRGWRKTGRPKQLNQSFTELKTVQCIIHGPEMEEIYNIAEMSKSSFVDKSLKFTSRMLGETMKFVRRCKSETPKREFIHVASCAVICWWFLCNSDRDHNLPKMIVSLGIVNLIAFLFFYKPLNKRRKILSNVIRWGKFEESKEYLTSPKPDNVSMDL
ncbi:hypothetical protein L2E82_24467 [Cichorium intybus]|uniref:Uncharacterized protein n=1 Tax=Cichorium intybus TaxID=13427 RepID=A0ACB9E147_CICIN|nr:hypothetical protein L2E82_24467 [Cichorium intybus]